MLFRRKNVFSGTPRLSPTHLVCCWLGVFASGGALPHVILTCLSWNAQDYLVHLIPSYWILSCPTFSAQFILPHLIRKKPCFTDEGDSAGMMQVSVGEGTTVVTSGLPLCEGCFLRNWFVRPLKPLSSIKRNVRGILPGRFVFIVLVYSLTQRTW